MSDAELSLAQRLLDDEHASAAETEAAQLEDTARVELSWALKELCYGAWHVAPDRAKLAANVLTSLAGPWRDHVEIAALTEWTKGIASLVDGQMNAAVDFLDAAAAHFNSAEKRLFAAQTQIPKIMALSFLGRQVDAEICAKQTRELFLIEKNDHLAGKVELNLASMLLQRYLYSDAATLYRQASVRFARVSDFEHSILADIGLADALTDAFEFDEALLIYERAFKRAEARKLPVLCTTINHGIGLLEFFRERPSVALHRLETARREYEANLDTRRLVECERDLADVYLAIGLLPEAVALYDRIIAVLDTAESSFEQAWCHLRRGRAMLLLEQLDAATTSAIAAETRFCGLNHEIGRGYANLLRSEVVLKLELPRDALALTELARRQLSSDSYLAGRLAVDFVAATAQLSIGDTQRAKALFENILEQARLVGLNQIASNCHARLGQIAELSNDNVAAQLAYEAAAELAEAQRALLQTEDARIGFRANSQTSFDRLVALAASRQSPAELLAAMERGRAQRLGSHKETDVSSSSIEMPTSALRAQLNWTYRQFSKDIEEGEDASEWQRKIGQIESELLEKIRRSQFSNLSTGSDGHETRVLDAKQLQAAMPSQDALIEYYIVEDALHICVVTSDAIQSRQVICPTLAHMVRQARFQIETIRGVGGQLASHSSILAARARQHMAALGRALLDPIASIISEKKRLLIVGHSFLHYVPYAALELNGSPLVDTHDVVALPTANALLRTAEIGRPRTDETIRIAPNSNALFVGSTHGHLKHVAHEVRALATLVPQSTCLIDNEASVARIQAALPQAEFIHFACHGEFRADSPYFSALHFADGAITVRDISDMKLRARLVTLSACETGLSQLSPGDELLGLTRAFVHAGVQSVVTSLWAVDDEATSQLMQMFYRHLLTGMRPSKALRVSQRQLRDADPRWHHPYFWAGFSLAGQP
jgi:CHAT domain-containing protein/tetratricopeptide (TPR) repeat protein